MALEHSSGRPGTTAGTGPGHGGGPRNRSEGHVVSSDSIFLTLKIIDRISGGTAS